MSEQANSDLMSKVVALCKRRGIIFQSSEIYGGINGFWDYGPNGAPLRRSIEQLWWRNMVEERDNVVGIDSTIICHPRVWHASGHVEQFADLMTDCLACKKRYRVDQLEDPGLCPSCGSREMTEPRQFNLMMKTYVGPVFDEEHAAYLRAESCQPIFVNFNTVRNASRQKIPFGIAQTGKAFRNEINPRFFTFRSREFMQMEMEFFCREEESMDWYEYWRAERWKFYTETLGIAEDKLRWNPHENLAHYAKAAVDIEYLFPFGWGEIEGIHHRGTYDMMRHAEYSGQEQDCKVFDQESRESYFPTVVETSCGLDRICLMMLCDGYHEDLAETRKEGKAEEERVLLRLPAAIAPVQVAVLPLSKKLAEPASELKNQLRRHFRTDYDEGGSIGRRYRRQDELGTPYCVTYDFDSLKDQAVTLRERDSMEQQRLPMAELPAWLLDKL
ncbi:MAG: glycine--tRNA ligase [Lentisphaerae bacterium]|nr:glycine--tRNA ligase [Lentisphaerota bacterium]